MKEEIRVLIIDPESGIREETVRNDLKTLQDLVGGKIEIVGYIPGIVLIVDEEGKLKSKPLCRTMCTHTGIRLDTLVGTVVVAGTDGEEFRGLDDNELAELKKRLADLTIYV